MKIVIVAAMDSNRGIGRGNKLPWHLPEDLRRFKRLTIGKTILMGKNTWDSLPSKPLEGRRNIVLTSANIDGVEVIRNADDVLSLPVDEIYIIGGQSLYEQFIGLANVIKLTLVKTAYHCDRYFPEIPSHFKETERISNEDYDFITFLRC